MVHISEDLLPLGLGDEDCRLGRLGNVQVLVTLGEVIWKCAP